MNSRSRIAPSPLVCLAGFLLLTFVGCGSEATVVGTVRLDGEPLKNGTVTFVPAAGGPVAYGDIQASGAYKVKTGASPGLPPGRYAVTVAAGTPAGDEIVKADDGSEMESTGRLLTPEIYASPKTTPLQADVRPGANTVDLTLSSKP